MKKKLDESSCKQGEGRQDEKILQAANILVQGGIVAIPTETYYGLAVDPENEEALERLFLLKKRPQHKPVLLLIHDLSQLDSLVSAIPELFIPLMRKYWPGPLTLIFPARPDLSLYLTGGTGTVGIRISPNIQALALCRYFGKALTATSANISGQAPARFGSDVVKAFGKNIDYVLDAGKTPAGHCSTIVGIEEGELCLLRTGAVEIAGVKQSRFLMPK